MTRRGMALKVVRIATTAALVCVSVSCGGDPCGTELLQEALSKDGKMKAVLFLRNCGATTDYVTAVSLVLPSENLTDDSRFFTPRRLGNVFRAKGIAEASVAWRSPDELIIAYRHPAEVTLREASKGRIMITYEHLQRADPQAVRGAAEQ